MGETEKEIKMKIGDDISVIDQTDENWWYGINHTTNTEGYFPKEGGFIKFNPKKTEEPPKEVPLPPPQQETTPVKTSPKKNPIVKKNPAKKNPVKKNPAKKNPIKKTPIKQNNRPLPQQTGNEEQPLPPLPPSNNEQPEETNDEVPYEDTGDNIPPPPPSMPPSNDTLPPPPPPPLSITSNSKPTLTLEEQIKLKQNSGLKSVAKIDKLPTLPEGKNNLSFFTLFFFNFFFTLFFFIILFIFLPFFFFFTLFFYF